MIDTDECFLHPVCNIYKKNQCHPHEFCLKLFKTNALLDLALFSSNQREKLNLRLDADGTDRVEYSQLRNIERDVENFIRDSRNLYLFSVNCGNGKTSWALRIGQSYINRIWHKSEIRCR